MWPKLTLEELSSAVYLCLHFKYFNVRIARVLNIHNTAMYPEIFNKLITNPICLILWETEWHPDSLWPGIMCKIGVSVSFII